MKKMIWLFVILFFAVFSRTHAVSFEVISNLLMSSDKSDQWVLKVDKISIGWKDFKEGWNSYLKMIPENIRSQIDEKQLKKAYLDAFIQQQAVVQKALSEGFFSAPDSEELIKNAIKQVIYQWYVESHLPKDKKKFLPSAKELNLFYEKNKTQFERSGMTAEQIKTTLVNELSKRHMKEWVQDLMDMVKEDFKIKRNHELLKQKGWE